MSGMQQDELLLNFGFLPFEIIMEIVKFLPCRFIISDRFVHILRKIMIVNGCSRYGATAIMNQEQQQHQGDHNDQLFSNYLLEIKKNTKQSIIDGGYIQMLIQIFQKSMESISWKVEIFNFLNPDGEFDSDLMVKVFQRLKIDQAFKVGIIGVFRTNYKDEVRKNIMKRFEDLDWSWKELEFLIKFIERYSFCCLCDSTTEGVNELTFVTQLKEIGGELNFEWYFCKYQSNMPRYYKSQIPGILKLEHINYDLPFKVRGCMKLKEGNIVFDDLWVKKPELCLDEGISKIPEQFGYYFRKFFYEKGPYNYDKRPMIMEIVTQLYWFPNLLRPNHIIRIRTGHFVDKSDIEREVYEPSAISSFLNNKVNLFHSRDSIGMVEMDVNVFRREKECTIIPKPYIVTIAPTLFYSLISLVLFHYSCLFNFRFSREFYNRHNISMSEIIWFAIGDVTSFALIGYFIKAYYCIKAGYFGESHITLVETLCNITLAQKIVHTISQLANTHYKKKSKRLPLFDNSKEDQAEVLKSNKFA